MSHNCNIPSNVQYTVYLFIYIPCRGSCKSEHTEHITRQETRGEGEGSTK